MMSENIENLIRSLVQKTNKKEAIWGKTSGQNEFKLIFDTGAVTTSLWNVEEMDVINIAIYNKFGDKIENYYANENEDEFELLKELHDSARKEFYKVDDTLKGLFEELKGIKSIGKREIENEPPSNNDDDLPF